MSQHNNGNPRIPRDDQPKAAQGAAPQEQSRVPRAAETSDSFARFDDWKPPETLPMPKEDPDWAYRYVRIAAMGQDDASNFSRAIREGWEPVKASEHPDLAMASDGGKDSIEIGGLILCRAPRRKMEQRKAYYEQKTREQQQAVDNDLMKQNDARMPMDAPSRKTKVSFGSGE